MRARLATALLAAALSMGWTAASAAQPAPQPAGPAAHANAQELAPAALLGAWKADVAASSYAGEPPQANIRTFSFTQDGKVLVTSTTRNSKGRVAMLHWAVQLDGSPSPEFTDYNGSTPTNVVALRMADETTFNLTVWRHGKVTLTGVMKLSADGQTLTYTYGGEGRNNTIIYRKWDMAS
ncbi:hypothetical protein [Phenylobacterium sp.]|uniref:hypothetical protein n=1 Tax=Phenylobacterium sp. TaxID=1871053 RepID=UPI0035AF9100